jgi:adhesin transport system outer membrane protein
LGRAKRERYFDLLNAAETTTLDTVTAYQDVQRYRELVALAKGNLDQHREVLGRIRDRVSAGVSRSVDLEQATGRYALAESNLVIEQSNLHDVSARYQRIVGEWPAENLAPAQYDKVALPTDLVTALKTAYGDHPLLAATAEGIRGAEEQLRNRKSRYLPRVDLQLRGDVGHDLDRVPSASNDVRAEVLLSYNLFNGGSDRAAVSQAHNLISAAQDRREAACRDVRQTLRIAYDDRQRLDRQLEFLKIHRDTTDKARTAYLNQFQIGQRTLLDLLDTENEYFQAGRAYTIGNYDYAIAAARTLAGEGHLRQAVGIARSDEPTLASLGGKDDDKWNGCPAQQPEEAPNPVTYAAAEAPAPKAELDSDHDGVPDSRDLCPDTPLGTPVDKVGCPFKEVVVMSGIRFAFNKAELTEPSKEVLNKSARILHDNPGMRVEVAGHTDSVGSADYNLKLSNNRARAVVDYLVSQGVAANQLTSVGYGMREPKVSNNTSAGRAVNRRTEFRIKENAPPNVKPE